MQRKLRARPPNAREFPYKRDFIKNAYRVARNSAARRSFLRRISSKGNRRDQTRRLAGFLGESTVSI